MVSRAGIVSSGEISWVMDHLNLSNQESACGPDETRRIVPILFAAAVQQALGAASPGAGFLVRLHGRADQAQRSTGSNEPGDIAAVGTILQAANIDSEFAFRFLGMRVASRWCMKRFNFFFAFLTLLLVASLSNAVAQQPPNVNQIRKLIAQSHSKDLKTSDEANEVLSKLDKRSLPALLSILKDGQPCEQVESAGLILDLDPKNPEIVPVMTDVTRGASLRTLFNLEEEMMCRRAAAYVLARSAEGIRVLTRLLEKGDLWEKQTAIFALDDLTETSDYPADIIPAMQEIVPEIAKAAKAKDRVLSEMADEVLGQIARGPNADLSALAKKYILDNS